MVPPSGISGRLLMEEPHPRGAPMRHLPPRLTPERPFDIGPYLWLWILILLFSRIYGAGGEMLSQMRRQMLRWLQPHQQKWQKVAERGKETVGTHLARLVLGPLGVLKPCFLVRPPRLREREREKCHKMCVYVCICVCVLCVCVCVCAYRVLFVLCMCCVVKTHTDTQAP